MTRSVLLVTAFLLISGGAYAARGQFPDALRFTEVGCEKQGQCKLKEKFGYIDSTGVGWEAAAGNKTDGASIPPDLKPYFGNSFDSDLIRAAVIHDHYCDRHVRRWYDTHWVFYDALLASGVDKGRAKLMLAGILLGGPKWLWLTKGTACATGRTCIQKVPTARLPGGSTTTNERGETVLARPARYNSPEFIVEMEKAAAKIESSGDMGPEDLLELAKSIRPDDEFLNGPDEILIPPPPPGTVDR